MKQIVCWECNKNPHSMGCGSKSRVDSIQWLLDDLHHVPQDVLDTVAFAVYTESLERKLAFYEYQEESELTYEERDNDETA